MTEIPDITIGLEFQAGGKTWEVKEVGWYGRWRCETHEGEKFSFLEIDIQDAIMSKEKP